MSVEHQGNAATALQQLRNKLLDLTGRNKLLSFRHTRRSCLRITDELPDQLLEVLLDGRELRFNPVPVPTREQLIQCGYIEVDEETGEETQVLNKPSAEAWAENLGMTAHFELPESSNFIAGSSAVANPPDTATSNTVPARYTDNSIQTLMFPEDLEATLRNLQRKTDLALQEMGTNILYLAFGFLEWYDSDQADKGRVAPLFLLPVNLSKGKLNAKSQTFEYLISYNGEDITPNLSLREKLKIDFSLELPELSTGDEISVEGYLEEIDNMFRVMYPRWRVLRHATLGFFDFTKLLMYLDLDPERWPDNKPLIGHPVIARFLGGGSHSGAQANAPREEYEIDKLDEVHDRYPLVFDADSSQHSAIVEVMDGDSLVIEGPPGTGKSQSISNLIAASIANGKRVLFVAEKLAALQVVKSRLDRAGLGDFVLELHSHKTQKRQLLDSIDERLKKRGSYNDSAEIEAEIARYERLRKNLSGYVELINSEWKDTGLTIFEIFTAATRYREVGAPLLRTSAVKTETLNANAPIAGDVPVLSTLYRPEVRDTQLAEIRHFTHVFNSTLDEACAAVPADQQATIAHHPWYGLRNDTLYAHDAAPLIDKLQQWQNCIDKAASVTVKLGRHIGSTPIDVADSLDQLYKLPEQLHCIKMPGHSINPEALGRLTDRAVLSSCQSEFELLNTLATQRRQLLPVVARQLAGTNTLDTAVIDAGATVSSRIKADRSLIEVRQLVEVINRLDAGLTRINQSVANAVTGLASHLQTRLYDGTENAVKVCYRFLASIDSLDTGLSSIRQRYGNSDAFRSTVASLHKDIREARTLHNGLREILNTRRLGDVEKLQSLLEGYNRGGMFRWLNNEWRYHRQTLKKLAAGKGVSVDQVATALPDGIRFSQLHRELENNTEYQSVLGEDYRGVNTDIESLTKLARWHQKLHAIWEPESDARQWVDALAQISGSTESNLRQLLNDGALDLLSQTEADLLFVRNCLHGRDPVQARGTALVGDNGAMEVLQGQLEHSLEPLTEFFATDDISVGDVTSQLAAIDSYKEEKQRWETLVAKHSTLADVFNIDIEHTQVNDERYVQVSSTLAFSDHLASTVSNQVIAGYIAQNPTDEMLSELNGFGDQIAQVRRLEQEAFQQFQQPGRIDIQQWQQISGTSFSALESRNYAAITQQGLLAGWLEYLRVTGSMKENGLGALVAPAEQGAIKAENFVSAWQGKIHDDLSREVLSGVPALATFSGSAHEALQEQFRECDERLLDLQRIRLAARVDCNEIDEGVSGAYVGDLTELKLLKHETRKKRRHIPIRQLVARASQALVQLKPCFMMGPLSAAQYLQPGQLEFDLVVMDEASQIKPEDALGVIARGRQLVVVGDPKQLPPTNFFNRTIDDEEEEAAVVSEQESILDATEPMFNTRRLRWHYRSRHEKLIAFSNYHFYDDNLVVFPSPARKSEALGIRYFRVDGIFSNRSNEVEARQIAEMVRAHYKEYPSDSIGVVAMNTKQRDTIDATIESLSREDPLFLEALEKSQHQNEPLFVKNLENVQGDERDVIVISLTYGPAEQAARVMQRFGPINSADGWRRLNVLLTRSRKRMLIYSSMSSSDIVVSPTSSRGVCALRDLLAYLETDTLHKTRPSGRAPDSDFEIDVIRRLERRGYICEPQIGVAGFFIDLAVVDPDFPGKFIVGIECDGATYHSARSARDRDRLRESVLTGLGWQIRRIWSTDYFKDPEGEIDHIARAIERLRAMQADKADELNRQDSYEKKEERDISAGHRIASTDGQSEKQQRIAQEKIQSASSKDQDLVGEPAGQVPEVKTLDEKLAYELNILAVESTSDSKVAMHNQLLRPDMISALVEYKPLSAAEYNALVPSFLRRSVHQSENAKLENIVALINRVCAEWRKGVR